MFASQIFLYSCLSFIGGIFLSSFFEISRLFWPGVFVLGILLLLLSYLLFYHSRESLSRGKAGGNPVGIAIFWIPAFAGMTLGLATGIFWHQRALNNNPKFQVSPYYNQEIVFRGVIVSEPEQRIDKTMFQVRAKDILGKILITTNLYPEYFYGDEIEIKGELKEPSRFEDFDYREYLTKDKIYSVMYYPEMIFLSRNQGNRFYYFIFKFKNKLRGNIETVLLPPQSSVLKAVFLGDKQGLSENLKEKLNIVGVRHIVAISGMHMIIMSEILLFLLLSFGLWRRQAFYFVLILLASYIIMIGAPASAVRAGLMAGLLMFAQQVGRLNSAGRSLVFVGTLMLAINPLLLKIDVGFQLSFAACLSIIYLKPIFDRKLAKAPEFLNLKDILSLTLAAQIGVLPLLIFHFGQFSLISPLANLLIVPFLPILMFSGLLVSFSGFVWFGLSKIIAWPVWLLINYIIKLIEFLCKLPLAAFEIKYFHWMFLIGYYLILFLIYAKQTEN